MSQEGLPCGSAGKEYTCIARDLGLIPALRSSPGDGKGYPLQYSGLENSMDCIVHGVTKSWTRLSKFHFHFMSQDATCYIRSVKSLVELNPCKQLIFHSEFTEEGGSWSQPQPLYITILESLCFEALKYFFDSEGEQITKRWILSGVTTLKKKSLKCAWHLALHSNATSDPFEVYLSLVE